MGNRSFFNVLHDREGDFLLATVLEGPAQGERVLLRNTAPVWPEELPAFWGEHLPALAAVTSSGILKSAGRRIFVERFGAAPQLVVCGGGHVGASVVRLAKLLGLPVTALEDRPGGAGDHRRPPWLYATGGGLQDVGPARWLCRGQRGRRHHGVPHPAAGAGIAGARGCPVQAGRLYHRGGQRCRGHCSLRRLHGSLFAASGTGGMSHET